MLLLLLFIDFNPKKSSEIVTFSEHTCMIKKNIAKQCEVILLCVDKIIKRYNQTGSFSSM